MCEPYPEPPDRHAASQMSLPLAPPRPAHSLPIRASPPAFIVNCPVCRGIHTTKEGYQTCVREHDRQQ
jgi:hypothetical protein